MDSAELTDQVPVNVGLDYGDYVDAQFMRLAWQERLTTIRAGGWISRAELDDVPDEVLGAADYFRSGAPRCSSGSRRRRPASRPRLAVYRRSRSRQRGRAAAAPMAASTAGQTGAAGVAGGGSRHEPQLRCETAPRA